MDEPFELPITYQGKDLLFPAQLVVTGYAHRFVVQLPAHEIIFERDEEGAYRALMQNADWKEMEKMDRHLLQAVAEAIEGIVGR